MLLLLENRQNYVFCIIITNDHLGFAKTAIFSMLRICDMFIGGLYTGCPRKRLHVDFEFILVDNNFSPFQYLMSNGHTAIPIIISYIPGIVHTCQKSINRCCLLHFLSNLLIVPKLRSTEFLQCQTYTHAVFSKFCKWPTSFCAFIEWLFCKIWHCKLADF